MYAPNGVVRREGSIHDVRHLYTGQLWMPAAGLYDYRNRVFSPALTRFLQPDPIGFRGDPSNLYRYCGNNGVNRSDPMGLNDEDIRIPYRPEHEMTMPRIWVRDTYIIRDWFNAMNWHNFADAMWQMGGGDRGILSPFGVGTILQRFFYANYASAFDDAFRQRAGYVLDIPNQTLANAPELVTGYSEKELNTHFPGSFYPTAINYPEQGNGIIYISNESFADHNDPMHPFRSYAHELANIVDYQIFQDHSNRWDPMFERHFGIRGPGAPFGDNDTGATVELIMFGPRR